MCERKVPKWYKGPGKYKFTLNYLQEKVELFNGELLGNEVAIEFDIRGENTSIDTYPETKPKGYPVINWHIDVTLLTIGKKDVDFRTDINAAVLTKSVPLVEPPRRATSL